MYRVQAKISESNFVFIFRIIFASQWVAFKACSVSEILKNERIVSDRMISARGMNPLKEIVATALIV